MAARDLFYKGEIAAAIIEFCQEEGGLLTMGDMANFRVEIETPVQTSYRGYDIYCCGPWCQGPVLAQALNLMELYDIKDFGHNTPRYIHLLTEALKLVFADREKYYGDPRFVDVPMTGLLSKEYAQNRKTLIKLDKAYPKMPSPGKLQTQEGSYRDNPRKESKLNSDSLPADTSYICAVDKKGNAFSATPSDAFCHTPIVPGLGIIISPRGAQSWLDPKHPSSIQPGKRPRLTPNPAIVLKDRQLFMAIGTPGGDVQCQTMMQVFLNIVEFGMTPQQAVEAPRFATWSFPNSFYPHLYHPGLLRAEGRLPEDTLTKLRNTGHKIMEWADWDAGAGSACVIVLDPETSVLHGGADPRRMAYAIGW
jgi:gamma-glutamyltranspeptidase/glutathione hydrolase